MSTLDSSSKAYGETLKVDFISAHTKFLADQLYYRIIAGITDSKAFDSSFTAVTDVVDQTATSDTHTLQTGLTAYCKALNLSRLPANAKTQTDLEVMAKYAYHDSYTRLSLILTDANAFVQEDQVPEISLAGKPQITTMNKSAEEWGQVTQLFGRRAEWSRDWCIDAVGTALWLLGTTHSPVSADHIKSALEWHSDLLSMVGASMPAQPEVGGQENAVHAISRESWSDVSHKISSFEPQMQSLVNMVNTTGTKQQQRYADLLTSAFYRLPFWHEKLGTRIEAAGGFSI